MNGLALARAYFEQFGRPLLDGRFCGYKNAIAAGLVGEGSECLGFDDAVSMDHDYGPGFCLWLPDALYEKIGGALQQAYDELPGSYLGVPKRKASPFTPKRTGVFRIAAFYRQFIGDVQPPETNAQWLAIPSDRLAAATSGDVFTDPLGQFSEIRRILLRGYPISVRNAKLSMALFAMAQAGQYNVDRCMHRGDPVAARLALNEFIMHALSVCYLLNNRYMPYYKWMYRGLTDLTDWKPYLTSLAFLSGCALDPSQSKASVQTSALLDEIEGVCGKVIRELRRLGLSTRSETFLLAHAVALSERTDCLASPAWRREEI